MSAKKRINICFLLGGREGGGMAASTLELIKRIDRERFNVRILFCEEGPYTARIRNAGFDCDLLNTSWPPRFRYYSNNGIKRDWIGIMQFLPWLLKNVKKFNDYIRQNHIDIVHTNYKHFHLIAGISCKLSKIKCVWHWRGVVKSSWVKHFGKMIKKLTSSYAWSIANSKATYDSVLPLTGNNVEVIYNGVEISASNQTQKLHKLLNLHQDVKIIGMVGSLNPIKGHLYFLEAAGILCPKYSNIHFVYIGGQTAAGQQTYHETLLEKRKQLGLENRIHFLGHRDDATELVCDFDIATVCTLPPGEGFGLVIVEAMAKGIPVISSDEGAAGEIIENNVSGILIPSANSNLLANSIEILLSDEEKRKKIGQAGLEACRKNFDIRQTIRKVENIYDRLRG